MANPPCTGPRRAMPWSEDGKAGMPGTGRTLPDMPNRRCRLQRADLAAANTGALPECPPPGVRDGRMPLIVSGPGGCARGGGAARPCRKDDTPRQVPSATRWRKP